MAFILALPWKSLDTLKLAAFLPVPLIFTAPVVSCRFQGAGRADPASVVYDSHTSNSLGEVTVD